MNNRWTEKEDEFLVAFYDALGAYIGPHDLNRTEAAIRQRASFLKTSGAWDALKSSQDEYQRYRNLAGYKSVEE